MPRLVQGIDLPAEGAACGDGLGWRPLSRSYGVPALGAAGQALGPPTNHPTTRLATPAQPSWPPAALSHLRPAPPPGGRRLALSRTLCPRVPRGAHLPAAPRMGSGSFSGRMGSAGGSGPVPWAGRQPSSSSPRSSSGAGGAGRLGMTRTGQLGRREGGGSRRGRREVGGGRAGGGTAGGGRGQGPGCAARGSSGVGRRESAPGRAGREERPGGAQAGGR